MAYLIIILFLFCSILAFFEDRIPRKQALVLLAIIGCFLVLLAGLKPIGIDPDSENYAQTYTHYDSKSADGTIEVSYYLLCSFFNYFTDDPHIIFFFYAFWGILLKLSAFYKYSPQTIFLSCAVYLSYYFEVHELMQIRTCILSGCLLLAAKEIVDQRRWIALGYILIGSIFHISGLILLPLLFLKTKPFSFLEKTAWSLFVLISLLFSFGTDAILNIQNNIPYIGSKIETYSSILLMGVSDSVINPLGVFHLFSIAIFMIILMFSEYISEKNKYVPFQLRIYALGLISYTAFGFIPELGERISMLLQTVSIPLFGSCIYILKPKWVSILFVIFVSCIFLNYGLQFIDFHLFWKTQM